MILMKVNLQNIDSHSNSRVTFSFVKWGMEFVTPRCSNYIVLCVGKLVAACQRQPHMQDSKKVPSGCLGRADFLIEHANF